MEFSKFGEKICPKVDISELSNFRRYKNNGNFENMEDWHPWSTDKVLN